MINMDDLSSDEKRKFLKRLLSEQAMLPASSYPLSYGQRALWFLYRLEPKSAAYNIMCSVKVSSNIDTSALRGAFKELIDRHPSLRATYTTLGGQSIQNIQEGQEVHFDIIDSASWSKEDLQKKMLDESERQFNLETGPVYRIVLFNNSVQGHILLIVIHHIAVDFWSLDLLLRELRILYSSKRNRLNVPFLLPHGRYSDFVNWQSETLASKEHERLWSYWQKQLAGELPVLNLPINRPRPPVQTYCGATHDVHFDENLTQQIKQLGKVKKATLFTTLLSAFLVLLYRYCNQEDIIVGSPTSGRNHKEFEDIVGYFANPVVFRADLSGSLSFEDFLSKMRQTVIDGLAHQDYPFPLLVERLQPIRDPSRSPIFQVAFVWEKQSHVTESLDDKPEVYESGDEKFEVILSGQMGAPFDLTFTIFEADNSLQGSLQYNTDLFDKTTINRMADNFGVLLRGILAQPGEQIRYLPLTTEREQHRVLPEWNDSSSQYPKNMCVHELFELQVSKTPEAVAVVFKGDQLTYRELNEQANQLAHHLRKKGVHQELLVGIFMERSIEMIVSILGVLKAGGAFLPLDPEYPKERLKFLLEDAHIIVLLTQERLKNRLPNHSIDTVFVDSDWELVTSERVSNLKRSTEPNNLVYIIYTSGSTGKPKGVMISHQGLVNYLIWCVWAYSVAEGEGSIVHSSISFDFTITSLFSPLLAGKSIEILPNDINIERLAAALINHRNLSFLKITPTHLVALNKLLPAESLKGITKVLILGGEELREEHLTFWRSHAPETRIINEYGPTEAVVGCCAYEIPPETTSTATIPIGRPVANTQLYILDSHLQPVPIGVTGELYIGGDGVARGYLNRPKLTNESFISNPFRDEDDSTLYRTGDLARYLPDANIEYIGRIDHQVKIHGFRVELGEIESMLREHPAVYDVVVIARARDSGSKRLVAYAVFKKGQTVSVTELRSYFKKKIPHYMVPSAFVILEKLPVSPNGKVDRIKLADLAVSRPGLQQEFVPPSNHLEKLLSEIWSQVLDVDKVGIYDNFFDLGGASIQIVDIVSRAKASGLQLRPEMIFQHQTIVEIATSLGSSPGDQQIEVE